MAIANLLSSTVFLSTIFLLLTLTLSLYTDSATGVKNPGGLPDAAPVPDFSAICTAEISLTSAPNVLPICCSQVNSIVTGEPERIAAKTSWYTALASSSVLRCTDSDTGEPFKLMSITNIEFR